MTPRVHLLMPHYGPVHPGAAESFYLTGTSGSVAIAHWSKASSSILPNAFNCCLLEALQSRDEGTATHVAMIHSDIAPEFNWIDVLYRELVQSRASVVSAVVPIKDGSGKTSTAIGDRGDPWAIRRYIQAEDRSRLPVTFGAHHVREDPNEVLLINTGLWLADLRADWWDEFPGFEMRTRIDRDDQGKRASQSRPEDWEWSRWMADRGIDYRATWAVRLTHHGNHGYTNQ